MQVHLCSADGGTLDVVSCRYLGCGERRLGPVAGMEQDIN